MRNELIAALFSGFLELTFVDASFGLRFMDIDGVGMV